MEALQQKLNYSNRRVKFAWAKFYEQKNAELHADRQHRERYIKVSVEPCIPEHIKDEMKAMAVALKKKWECPVCMDMIDDDTLEITNCGHCYCKPCLEQWKETCKKQGHDKWSCGLCNRKYKYNE
jgi:hypothetical protein